MSKLITISMRISAYQSWITAKPTGLDLASGNTGHQAPYVGNRFRMLSQTTEYAMRAVVCLADRDPAPQTRDQISEATKVPGHYLSKILQHLSRAQLLRSQRGLGGGFTLAKPADTMTLLDIVNAVEPIQRIHRCPLEIAGHGVNLCPLHRCLDDTMAMVEKNFEEWTIARILKNRTGSLPLCPFPLAATPSD